MKWLHFSDLHFQHAGYDEANLRTSLLSLMKSTFSDVDFIVITGDIMNRGGVVRGLNDFIAELISAAHISKDELFICPGNHDVRRDAENRRDLISRERSNNSSLDDSRVKKLSESGFDLFDQTYRVITEKGYKSFEIFDRSEDGYRIVSLNSCLLAGDQNDEGNIRVLCPELEQIGRRISSSKDVLNIAIMHHGIEYHQLNERLRFEHWADDSNIDLVLCGHVHRPGLCSYDDTVRSIKQLTAGTVHDIDYEMPAFFAYSFEPQIGKLNVSLFSYSKSLDYWVANPTCLRAFERGTFTTYLPRLSKDQFERFIISGCDTPLAVSRSVGSFLKNLNDRYKEYFGPTILNAGDHRRRMTFSIHEIVQSLIDAEIPLTMALEVISRAIEDLINNRDQFEDTISTSQLGYAVYEAIRRTPTTNDISDYDLRAWSGKYARQYLKTGLKSILIGKSKKAMSYSTVKNYILPTLFSNLSINDKEIALVPSGEQDYMAEAIIRMAKNFDLTVISDFALITIVREISTKEPHPWLVDEPQRIPLIKYNKKKIGEHLQVDKQRRREAVTYSEIVYHASSIALLFCRFNVIGCKERSPLRILNSIVRQSRRNNSLQGYANNILNELRGVFEKSNENYDEFITHVTTINKLRISEGCILSESDQNNIVRYGRICKALHIDAL